MQTSLKEFAKPDFSVVRQHEEFIWLHDRFEEDEAYAGYIVSSKPTQLANFMEDLPNLVLADPTTTSQARL